jgi:hypothetical protein
MPDLPQWLTALPSRKSPNPCGLPIEMMRERNSAMTTASSHLSGTQRTLSGPVKRRLLTVGLEISAMLGRLSAEYSRAAAASRRYHELTGGGRLVSRSVEAASIPRTIFEEFYGGSIGWHP